MCYFYHHPLPLNFVPGIPKKVHKFEIKIFLLRTDQSVKFMSFVRQVLNLDFDT